MSKCKRFVCVLAGVLALVTGFGGGVASAAPTAENVVTVTSANYAEVMNISKEKLVIMDFGATWCPPCRQMKPVIERLAGEYGGRFLLGEVDVDQSRDLSTRYNIRYLPTLVGVRNAAELPSSRNIGYPGETKLRAWIDAQLAKG
ncbi:co-chaperone YbbN [Amycolatopsis sp. EV170708-02-1]|uniref:thioredoxin family protein n=1 Tax=Amycolatopsis sp. EV170708-02-1 TaxID=2919322 RepID=UPI001F0CA03A|nr:thioredoxin family protein [Amycolatopsis sp. EV170708-02-1]UMP05511.1 thioredoxin family protein [Amycolatopsis sp. EV170708-02-1]